MLGFRQVMGMPGMAAFLQAEGSTNDHDLGLFQIGAQAGPSEAGRRTVGLYHLAWEVDTLAELQRIAERLSREGAIVGASDHGSTKALYAKDPDGLEFEVSWLVPADLLTPEVIDVALVHRPAGPGQGDRPLRRRDPRRRRGVHARARLIARWRWTMRTSASRGVWTSRPRR